MDFKIGFGEGNSPYLMYEILPLPQEFYIHLREFGASTWGTLMNVTKLVTSFDELDLVDELGIPADYYTQILGMQHIPPADMRFDIAVKKQDFENKTFSSNSFKILEVNAATPSFFWESFEGTRLVCDHFGVKDPNSHLLEGHMSDMKEYLTSFSKMPSAPIVFSFPFYGENHEDILCFDLRVGAYQKYFGEDSARFVYSDSIIFNQDGAFENGIQIHNLFMHLPSEYAISDQGIQHNGTIDDANPWQIMTEIILENKLNKFPPISADVLQNKSLLAFMYTQAAEGAFDDHSRDNILSFLPPTYFYYADAETNLEMFWEKPVYGREGCGVKLFDNEGTVLYNSYSENFDDWAWYESMPAIFQEHQELPTVNYSGEEFELVFTVYVSPLGRGTGVGCRACPVGQATSELQGMWLPLSVC